jgi:hypothetical protein
MAGGVPIPRGARVPLSRRAAVAAAGAVAALTVAAWQLPGELRGYDNQAAAARQRSRELPVASLSGIDPGVVAAAARLIPSTGRFAIAIPASPDLRDLVFQSLAPNALLPRRRVPAAAEADWVLAFRVDPRSLGVRAARVVLLSRDLAAIEVAR